GRVREDVDDRADPDVDAGLLCSFAHRREPRVLTDVEVAAGQRPATAPGFHRAAHEEQPVVAEHGNSYGDLRVGVVDVATGGAVTAGDATDVAGGHRRPALRAEADMLGRRRHVSDGSAPSALSTLSGRAPRVRSYRSGSSAATTGGSVTRIRMTV